MGLIGRRFCYSSPGWVLGLAATLAAGLTHPLWFPLYLLYGAVQEIRGAQGLSFNTTSGREEDEKMARLSKRLNAGKLLEKFGRPYLHFHF